MATSTKKNRARRRRGRQEVKQQSGSRYMIVSIAVIVLALIGFFTLQTINRQTQSTTSVVQADTGSLESLNIEDNQDQHGVEAAPVTDRETRFLGPASDPAAVSLAQTGDLGQPTLVWFHADW